MKTVIIIGIVIVVGTLLLLNGNLAPFGGVESQSLVETCQPVLDHLGQCQQMGGYLNFREDYSICVGADDKLIWNHRPYYPYYQ